MNIKHLLNSIKKENKNIISEHYICNKTLVDNNFNLLYNLNINHKINYNKYLIHTYRLTSFNPNTYICHDTNWCLSLPIKQYKRDLFSEVTAIKYKYKSFDDLYFKVKETKVKSILNSFYDYNISFLLNIHIYIMFNMVNHNIKIKNKLLTQLANAFNPVKHGSKTIYYTTAHINFTIRNIEDYYIKRKIKYYRMLIHLKIIANYLKLLLQNHFIH